MRYDRYIRARTTLAEALEQDAISHILYHTKTHTAHPWRHALRN